MVWKGMASHPGVRSRAARVVKTTGDESEVVRHVLLVPSIQRNHVKFQLFANLWCRSSLCGGLWFRSSLCGSLWCRSRMCGSLWGRMQLTTR